MHIIIIDDDAEDTEMFCHALQEVAPEIQCEVANNPTTAIRKIKDNELQPEYIFLDANMFIIDGKECLRQLRALPWLNNTKILMYSGYINEQQLVELKQLGANEYIHKPNTYDELCSMLRSMFGKRTLAN